MTLLEVEALVVTYGAVAAVKDVSLDVQPGEIVAMLGANGAGKTTTLRAISGLVRTRAGRIRFDGNDLLQLRPDAVARLGIAHVPAARGIFPSLSVEENLRMAQFGASHVPTLALADAMRQFPILEEKRSQPAGELSGGQQQQLAIARALVQKPRLLLLDEMSMGLSPAVVADLFAVIEGLREQGVAVLMVEQFVTEALRVADRAVVLEQGRVATSGSAQEIGSSDVTAAYLGHGSADVVVGPPPPTARESYTISLPGSAIRMLENRAAEGDQRPGDLIADALRQLAGEGPQARVAPKATPPPKQTANGGFRRDRVPTAAAPPHLAATPASDKGVAAAMTDEREMAVESDVPVKALIAAAVERLVGEP